MPRRSDDATGLPRRVSVDPQGPVLIEGPVEIVLADGTIARSERFMVAICTCRRSRTYPWCDTSHRPRKKVIDAPSLDQPGQEARGGHDTRATGPAPNDRNSP
ncbi:CDGSH iron-sulfur domain-containing protein [Streptomyces fagopyri]|uniref:CDGSH iron-sulfur domain-containing protein n=1 Tax=Streptomyces fagopyri TaxID=2662397 RepID=UPI0033ED65E3